MLNTVNVLTRIFSTQNKTVHLCKARGAETKRKAKDDISNIYGEIGTGVWKEFTGNVEMMYGQE